MTLTLRKSALAIGLIFTSVPAAADPIYRSTVTGGTWTFQADDFTIAMPDVTNDDGLLRVDTGAEWYPGCGVTTTPITISSRPGFVARVTVSLTMQSASWDGKAASIDAMNRKMFTAEFDDGASTWVPKSIYLYAIDPHPTIVATRPDGSVYLSAQAADRTLTLPPFVLQNRAPSFTVGVCELIPNLQMALQKVEVAIQYQHEEE